MGIFSRYTDAAKRAIYFANIEAVHRNQSQISPRDILMGLTWEADTRADRIGDLKARAAQARFAVQLPYLPSSSMPYKAKRPIPLSCEGKMLLAFAVKEANRSHDYWIDTDHLLRGVVRLEEHCSNRALKRLSQVENDASGAVNGLALNLKHLRKASAEDLKTNPAAPISVKQRSLYLGNRYKWVLWLAAVLLLILVLRLRQPV